VCACMGSHVPAPRFVSKSPLLPTKSGTSESLWPELSVNTPSSTIDHRKPESLCGCLYRLTQHRTSPRANGVPPRLKAPLSTAILFRMWRGRLAKRGPGFTRGVLASDAHRHDAHHHEKISGDGFLSKSTITIPIAPAAVVRRHISTTGATPRFTIAILPFIESAFLRGV